MRRRTSSPLRKASPAVKRLSLADMQKAARLRGGRCLSASYVNCYTPLRWECARGHRWSAIAHSVRQGHWCNACAVEKRRQTLGLLRALAAERGGKCMAESYRNSQTKVPWQCANGHRWSAIPNALKRGSWCLECWRASRLLLRAA